jgi:hypothetical protein
MFLDCRTLFETQLLQVKTTWTREESRQIETNEQHERESSRRTWTNYETFVRVMVATSNNMQVAAKTPEEKAKARAKTSLEPQFVFHGHRAQVFAANFLQVPSVQVR